MKALAVLAVLLCACGGGGGGGGATAFKVVSTVPADGTIGFAPGTWISINFSDKVDVSTLSLGTLMLLRTNGTQVPANIVTDSMNPRNVRVQPSPDLPPDSRFQLVVKSAIRSASGTSLNADTDVCFITGGPTPAVREDQILDLGDQLNVPRYLAQVVRIGNRVFVLGGHSTATDTTDTVEEWDPGTRSFKLLASKLLSPRAEFTATLLQDGRILVVGGVAAPGGAPLDTTEYYDPAVGSSPGPPLLEARRWHAASRFRSGLLVSGGFGDAGDPLDTLEYLEGGSWHAHSGHLGEPSAQHLQFSRGFDDVYVSVGNLSQIAARVDSVNVVPFLEPDARFRPQGVVTHDGRVMIVAGDTRSIVIHDFDTDQSWLATKLLFDRRGAYSLTQWGSTSKLYLAAGGFQITAGGRTIPSLEIIEYIQNPGGSPNATVYYVAASQLPFPMAGHVGFNDPSGATVLAGGLHDQDGEPTRSVVMILDDRTTPPATCK